MRTFIGGALVGLATAAAVVWLRSRYAAPSSDVLEAQIAGGAALAVAAPIWVVGALRAIGRGLRSRGARRRYLRERRKQLAERRATFRPRPGDPNEPTVLLRRSTLERRKLRRGEAKELMRDAMAHRANGDFEGALQCLDELLDAEPEHPQGLLLRGRVYGDIGEFNHAINDLLSAEELSPDDPGPPTALGELAFSRKDYAKTILHLDAAVALVPEAPALYLRRGLAHSNRGSHALALADFRRARKLDPETPGIDQHIASAERRAREQEASRPRGRRR